MQKFFQSGHAFLAVALIFLVVSVVAERSAVYLAVAVVFFILGLAARKKNAQQSGSEATKNEG